VTDTVALARAGDEEAFRRLTEPYRHELHVHCYRMLGSVADADEALQDTVVAAWRGLAGFEGRSSLRTWLYRIATNRCLNARRRAGRRPAEPVPPFDPPEPTRRGDVTWLGPYPDALLPEGTTVRRETIELAFVAGLQRLPHRQAAVLVLRDVLAFSTDEVAALLDTTGTAVKAALQRARATMAAGRDAAGPPPPPAGSPAERRVARRFAEAFAAGDVDGVVVLLTDDAWLRMPPAPHEYHGPDAIGAFLRVAAAWQARRPVTLTPTRANGQPAFLCSRDAADAPWPHDALVLTLAGDRVAAITRFLDPSIGTYVRAAIP
jgi:RNA polymerase sigma-70 factor (ECF subfamily)